MVLGVDLFFSLFNNLAIFIALVAIYSYLIVQFKHSIWFRRQLFLGLAFGLFAIGCMYAKIPVFEGVIVDQRNTIVTLSGVFGGPFSAFLSASLAGAFRVSLGGDGAFAGVVGVTLAAIAGIVLNRFHKPFESLPKAAISAFFATLVILPGFLFVKDFQTGWELMKAMSGPYGLAIFLGIFLVGSLLSREEKRYKIELLLSESEERFRMAIMSAPLPIMLHADDNEVLLINTVWTELTGYTLSDIPTTVEWTRRAYGAVGPKVQTGIDTLYSLETRRDEGMHSIDTQGGKQLIWAFTSSPLGQLPDGRKVVISMAMDVTERNQAEEEREKLIAQLQDKTAEQERFVYTVSHDMKSPLVTISSFLGIIEQDFYASNETGFKSNLAVISNAAKRMRQLLEELLELSRLGVRDPSPEKVNLGSMANKSIENISGLLTDSNATIEVEPDLPDVMVDVQNLLQVFENLIANAVKFSSGAKDRPIITIGIRRDEGELVCFVKDNGIGIEQRYENKVFDLFEKLDPNSGGTGVGLAIVKRIIENHSGKIWIESEGLGRGSTFCFTVSEVKD